MFEFRNTLSIIYKNDKAKLKKFDAIVYVPLDTLIIKNGEVLNGQTYIIVNNEKCSAIDFYALYYFNFVAGNILIIVLSILTLTLTLHTLLSGYNCTHTLIIPTRTLHLHILRNCFSI